MQLPEPLREAAGPGGPCCLFWPSPKDAAEAAHHGQHSREESLVDQIRNSAAVKYLRLAVKVSALKLLRLLLRTANPVQQEVDDTQYMENMDI